MRILISFAAVLVALSVSTISILAVPQTSPKQIVEALYKPYLADPHAEKSGSPGALDLILPYASKSLQSAIHKNEECERREQGICNIDFDIIINAQDWDLSNFTHQKETKNQLPVVRAIFSNGGKNKVSYFFIREQGDWRIDDVEAIRYKHNGAIEYKYKLKKELVR
jgi:Protein of unknown function (DUF3828)